MRIPPSLQVETLDLEGLKRRLDEVYRLLYGDMLNLQAGGSDAPTALTSVLDTSTINLTLTNAGVLSGAVIESGLHLADLGERSYNSLTDTPDLTSLLGAYLKRDQTVSETTLGRFELPYVDVNDDLSLFGDTVASDGEKVIQEAVIGSAEELQIDRTESPPLTRGRGSVAGLYLLMSFKVTSAFYATKFVIQLSRYGDDDLPYTCSLRTFSGGEPTLTDLWTDSFASTALSITTDLLDPQFTEITFTLPSPVYLAAGEYGIAIIPSGIDTIIGAATGPSITDFENWDYLVPFTTWTKHTDGSQFKIYGKDTLDETQSKVTTPLRPILFTKNHIVSSYQQFNFDDVSLELNCPGMVNARGSVNTEQQFVSTLAAGIKPIDVTSTTLCDNLNADQWDSQNYPLTNVGDLFIATTAGAASRLADVAAGSYLRSGGVDTAPLWSTLILPNAATAYRLAVATSANTIGELAAVGTTGEYLKGNTGAIPSWATLNQAAVAGLTTASSPTFAGLTLSTHTDNAVLYSGTSGEVSSSANLTFTNNATATLSELLSAGNVSVGAFLKLPTTSSTVGQILQNNVVVFHTYGTTNLFIGANAGNLTTSGTGQNCAVGASALNAITTGNVNMGFGYNAGLRLTSGVANVLIGRSAGEHLLDNTNTGSRGESSYNVFIGQNAGYTATYADRCVAIGNNALYSATQGNYHGCVAIGASALYTATGKENTAIGNAAGYLISTATGCVLIGNNAGRRLTTETNTLIIDNKDRSNHTNELAQCLIYGLFDGTAANQTLTINAATSIVNDKTSISSLKASKNAASVSANMAVADFVQDASDGACEVLRLQQDDASEEFIDFVGTDGGATGADSGASIIVALSGTKYKLKLYALS